MIVSTKNGIQTLRWGSGVHEAEIPAPDGFAYPQPTTEAPAIDQERAAGAIRDLLEAVGEDPAREGLRQTPHRVARAYGELLAGYQTDLDQLLNGALFASDHADMVVVRDIEYYSLCEHHLLPFYGHATVAYIPDGSVIGLSKIPRIVDMFAQRLQIQERLTRQIAECIDGVLRPAGVAVRLDGVHLCARMRGVGKQDSAMATSCFLGAFQDDSTLRGEFLSLTRN